jgi:hypothetical protein
MPSALARRAANRIGRGLGNRFHFGFLVDGDLGEFTVIAFQTQGLLVTVRGLSPHLDSADWAATLVHDYSLHLRQPPAMAYTDILSDPES